MQEKRDVNCSIVRDWRFPKTLDFVNCMVGLCRLELQTSTVSRWFRPFRCLIAYRKLLILRESNCSITVQCDANRSLTVQCFGRSIVAGEARG